MHFPTLFVFLSIAVLFVSTTAHPARHLQKAHGGLSRRQIEEELAQGAEESIELFDVPRVHDSSEKIKEGAQQNNITTNTILAELERRRRQQGRNRLRPVALQQQTYSYSTESGYAGHSESVGPGPQWQETGYGGFSRQSGFGGFEREPYK